MTAKPNSGFTLIELLLAAALLGVIMGVSVGMISGVLGGSMKVTDGISEDDTVGEIEDIIAGDLSFLVTPAKQGAFQMRKESDSNSSLSFYSACGAKTAWGDVVVPIHKVTYQVKPMPGGRKGLFRGEEPLAQTREAYYDVPVLLAEGVRTFLVEGYATRGWVSQWPGEYGGPLPLLVRVQLELDMQGGRTRLVYVESAPSIETIVKPEAERRASGGEPSGQGESGKTEQPVHGDRAGPLRGGSPRGGRGAR